MSEKKDELIPAIIQDHKTGEVLMLAYMNDESLKKTIETGTTWFWSRSRQKYWNKGESSGNTQIVKELLYDCDEDTYLVLVEQIGGVACHTGNRSCFYRSMYEADDHTKEPFSPRNDDGSIFSSLFEVIEDRKKEMPDDSYTASLLKKGVDKICDKIEEESAEVVEAAKIKAGDEVVWEASDLIYHLFILLAAKELTLNDVEKELLKRRGKN